jgi:hypothetical protein
MRVRVRVRACINARVCKKLLTSRALPRPELSFTDPIAGPPAVEVAEAGGQEVGRRGDCLAQPHCHRDTIPRAAPPTQPQGPGEGRVHGMLSPPRTNRCCPASQAAFHFFHTPPPNPPPHTGEAGREYHGGSGGRGLRVNDECTKGVEQGLPLTPQSGLCGHQCVCVCVCVNSAPGPFSSESSPMLVSQKYDL